MGILIKTVRIAGFRGLENSVKIFWRTEKSCLVLTGFVMMENVRFVPH